MSISRVMPGSLLHDDTEEDLVGADWHQHAIVTIVTSLQALAAEHDLQWHVGNQLPFLCMKPDRTSWRPVPDLMLHSRAGDGERAEMSLGADGLPELIIEVASPSTWQYDVDTTSGKAWGYMQLGVANYLVFDPAGDLLGEECRGWQRRAGATVPWNSAHDGRYHAIGLTISFKAEGSLLRVFDQQGNPLAFPHETVRQLRTQQQMIHEQEQALHRQEQEMNAQAARIAALEAELARLRRRE
jgi:putative restriction endonuclease